MKLFLILLSLSLIGLNVAEKSIEKNLKRSVSYEYGLNIVDLIGGSHRDNGQYTQHNGIIQNLGSYGVPLRDSKDISQGGEYFNYNTNRGNSQEASLAGGSFNFNIDNGTSQGTLQGENPFNLNNDESGSKEISQGNSFNINTNEGGSQGNSFNFNVNKDIPQGNPFDISNIGSSQGTGISFGTGTGSFGNGLNGNRQFSFESQGLNVPYGGSTFGTGSFDISQGNQQFQFSTVTPFLQPQIQEKIKYITKEVKVPIPQPYPVEVVRQVPVKIHVKVPVEVPKPYPIKVPHPVPVPVKVNVPVEVPKPYPVTVTKTIQIPVEKSVYVRVPHPIKVPVPQPYPVPVAQPIAIKVPTPIIVKVPEIVNLNSSTSNKGNIDLNINPGSGTPTGVVNSGHGGYFYGPGISSNGGFQPINEYKTKLQGQSFGPSILGLSYNQPNVKNIQSKSNNEHTEQKHEHKEVNVAHTNENIQNKGREFNFEAPHSSSFENQVKSNRSFDWRKGW